MTDHLKDFAPSLEKYKALQFFPTEEDKNQEECKFVGKFTLHVDSHMVK